MLKLRMLMLKTFAIAPVQSILALLPSILSNKRMRITRFPIWRRWLGSALCLILLALIIRDGVHAQRHDDGTLQRIKASGVLTVGLDPSNPPFADGRNGEPIGLDVDVINAVAARLGMRVQTRVLGYDGLYDALKIGQVDVLISALPVDSARLNDVIYTHFYFDGGVTIVSRGQPTQHMRDLEGQTAAVEYGSSADETARRWQRRLHKLDTSLYATTNEALDALYAGKTDAALADVVSARLYQRTHPGLTLSAQPIAPEPYAIVTRFDSFKLAGAIDDAVDQLLRDGTIESIAAKWM